jgi:hypothetical protein
VVLLMHHIHTLHINLLRDRFTVNMDEEELMIHRETLRLIEKDIHFVTRNAAEVQDEDDE